MKTFTVKKQKKLCDFLIESYNGGISYGTVMKLLRKKDVKVNGIRVNKDVTLNVGDEICCYYDGEKTVNVIEVYKDDNLLVADKPSKITSEDFETIVKKQYPSARLCHRLDTNTDGLLCFSLNDDAYDELSEAFKKRTVSKRYLAETYGKFDKPTATLTDYLVKDAKRGLVKIYDTPVKNSVKIITKYQTLKTSGETSLLDVELVTGKTHQIRAHLAYYGHFIIGDGKYGKNEINERFNAKTQRLTAYLISFNFSGKLSYLNGKKITLKRSVYGMDFS